MNHEHFIYEGIETPNSCSIPTDLLARLMPRLNHPEWKVVSYVALRTFGWNMKAEAISIKEMCEGRRDHDGTNKDDGGTGLKRSAVLKAIASLRRKGILIATQNVDPYNPKLRAPTTYRLRFKGEPVDTAEAIGS